MAISDRRERETAARHQLIVRAARQVAEREGWDAVTTRRLSAEIEYSQPVIYKHFASMDALAQAVALQGFTELGAALADARHAAAPGGELLAVAVAYTAFAEAHPALYDIMFTRITNLHFGPDAEKPLHTAFVELSSAVAGAAGTRDLATLTEVVWASLHGLTVLTRAQRLRPEHVTERLQALLDLLGLPPG